MTEKEIREIVDYVINDRLKTKKPASVGAGFMGHADFLKWVKRKYLKRESGNYQLDFEWMAPDGEEGIKRLIGNFVDALSRKLGLDIKDNSEIIREPAGEKKVVGMSVHLVFPDENSQKLGKYKDFLDL